MADITVRNQGEVEDSGKVNWRGDQVSLTPGGQSVYKSSSIQLAQLGARKVVGDRVFRYMQAQDTIPTRTGVAQIGSATTGAGTMITVTAGTGGVGGTKVTIANTGAGTCAANEFAEGYIAIDGGTAHTEWGYLYRIKSHPAMAASTNADFILYDPLAAAVETTDFSVLYQNLYYQVGVLTATGEKPIAICPVSVVTGDYFWGQTWGPALVQAASAMAIGAGFSLAAGQATIILDTAAFPGVFLTTASVISRGGIVFLEIAP